MDGAIEEINGDPATMAVERAIGELRRGRAVDIVHDRGARRVAALETVSQGLMTRLIASGGGTASVLITEHRSRAIGLNVSAGVELSVSTTGLTELQSLAGLSGPNGSSPSLELLADASTDPSIGAALNLAGSARLVPALLSVPRDTPVPDQILEVSVDAVVGYAATSGRRLERVSRARVPMECHSDCELVLYRDHAEDAEHVAVLIGKPSTEDSVLVRLHSSCLTGDLLGSLRCDCGEQLRDSVDRMAAAGGGVLIYLAQEGRGIGLANKLRAYALQDDGLDTIDADRYLGFSADERRYRAAATMLRDLGLTRIRLMTNNPGKLSALRAEGIELVDHVTLNSTVNPHNERYLRAKRERSGHL
jgi:GTP cyclohydrolase II